MRISAKELASIVERASLGATPNEVNLARMVANEIRSARRGATFESECSRSLHSIIDASSEDLGPCAVSQLSTVHIYGYESSYINAIPDVSSERKIIVFDGIKHLIYYHIALIKVVDRLQKHRDSAKYLFSDGELIQESLAFSMAGYSILTDFQETRRVPAAINDMLGERAQGELIAAFRGALCFVLMHELAHIELGHLSTNRLRSERFQPVLLESETLNQWQAEEMEADLYAWHLIQPATRHLFVPSIIFFLGAYTFIEVFSGPLNTAYPLAVNRLSNLLSHTDMKANDMKIAVSWVEQQANTFRNLSIERDQSGGSIRERIHESMPVDKAYKIIGDIKSTVSSEYGPLDADAVYL